MVYKHGTALFSHEDMWNHTTYSKMDGAGCGVGVRSELSHLSRRIRTKVGLKNRIEIGEGGQVWKNQGVRFDQHAL